MLANMILETTTNPGTSTTVNLAGAVTGFSAFTAGFSNGASIYYVLRDGTQWETGAGTFNTGSPNTISRTTVIANSAGNTSRLNFTGLTQVYNTVPASRMVYNNNGDSLQNVTATAISVPVWGGTAGGTANALTIAPSPAIAAYVAGQMFFFVTGASANSGATTINVNGLGAKTLGTAINAGALASGALPANTLVFIHYDGTSFRLLTGEGKYLPLAGGTLSGNVAMGANRITGLGDPTSAKDAANRDYADTKLALAGGTLIGDLTVAKANPLVALQKAGSGEVSRVQGQITGGVLRWTLDLGDTATETGSNAGSDFVLSRYNDAGTFIDAPLVVARNSGAPVFADPALWRSALSVPALPISASGVGQWASLNPGTGNAVILPAGGTWAWWFMAFFDPAGTISISSPISRGVNAGGTNLQAGVAGAFFSGVAWRIA
jgi:hypothetical protein